MRLLRTFAAAALAAFAMTASAEAAPTYNWSGFYIGVNAGGGMANGAFTDDCYFCATDAFSNMTKWPSAAPAGAWMLVTRV